MEFSSLNTITVRQSHVGITKLENSAQHQNFFAPAMLTTTWEWFFGESFSALFFFLSKNV